MNTILRFSSVYVKQMLSKVLPDAVMFDFTSLNGVRGYCDEPAAKELRRQLSEVSPDGIHFLDSGNYHYASLFFLEKLKKPFSLVVFDHHTDMQPSLFGDLLSCGSWIWNAVQTLPHLKEILLIGVGEESLRATREVTLSQAAFSCSPETDGISEYHYHADGMTKDLTIAKEGVSADTIGQLYQKLHYPVYLSIDKDVLSEEELQTDWDQGSMSLTQLKLACRTLICSLPVLGCDICGEPSGEDAVDAVVSSRRVNLELIASLSEKCNHMLLIFIRHGKTKGNEEKRYIGSTDEPLCPDGRKDILALAPHFHRLFTPDIVISSPMRRCLETAELLFPEYTPHIQEDFRETDFGAFEGKNCEELNRDPDLSPLWQSWIDSNGTLPFPNGEDRNEFIKRTTLCFDKTITKLIEEKKRTAVFSLHGGSIMALLDTFAENHSKQDSFYSWQVANGDGCLLTLDLHQWQLGNKSLCPLCRLSELIP